MDEHIQHLWERTGVRRPHFHEINSRRVYNTAIYFRCPCGQTAFRYEGYRVMYTWTPKEEDWETSLPT